MTPSIAWIYPVSMGSISGCPVLLLVGRRDAEPREPLVAVGHVPRMHSHAGKGSRSARDRCLWLSGRSADHARAAPVGVTEKGGREMKSEPVNVVFR